MQCTHCGSTKYTNNGSYKGVRRYKCKECKRYFSDKVRKFTYKDKERFIQLYLNNVGINKAALFIGCSPALLVRWVREYADNLRKKMSKAVDSLEKQVPDVIEMDEIYTRVKKGEIAPRYGLLILEDGVKLLHIASGPEETKQ